MQKILISPSILSGRFDALGETVEQLEENGADLVHVDVMDGVFVRNITIGIPVVAAIKKRTSLPLDVHLMIKNPLDYIEDFAAAGSDLITFHIESDSDVSKTISAIKKAGKKAGLSLKPGTPASAVFPYLPDLDLVLVMSVEPGFGGQKFMPSAVGKIAEIKREAERTGKKNLLISTDGGIDGSTIKDCIKAGGNCFAAGSSVFKAPDMKAAIEYLRSGGENS